MRVKEIIGKKVIDNNGKEVGDVKDVEIDWAKKSVKAVIIDKESAVGKEVARALLELKLRLEQFFLLDTPQKELGAVK